MKEWIDGGLTGERYEKQKEVLEVRRRYDKRTGRGWEVDNSGNRMKKKVVGINKLLLIFPSS